MARIDLKTSQIGSFGTGDLQLQNGDAMDATLRLVTDALNTASPLKLSTSLVQSTSTIKITTSDVAYIDAEDNSGNNRFTVSRASASQLVTVDFASVPTDLTTAVGAIRTATDGVNLANVMTFLENGKIGINTDTPSYKLDIKDATSSQARFYGFQNGVATDDSGEIILGSNGSLQGILKYKGAGGQLIFQNTYANNNSQLNLRVINTATTVIDGLTVIGSGNVGINQTAPTARLQVVGSGSTSATTSLLVQNSAGTSKFFVDDSSVGADCSIGNLINGYSTLQWNANSVGIGLVAGGGIGVRVSNGGFTIGTATTISNTASAILDANSTTKGFLPPRMTTAQKNAIATPAAGLMVYDSTLNKLCVYTTAWETITSV